MTMNSENTYKYSALQYRFRCRNC